MFKSVLMFRQRSYLDLSQMFKALNVENVFLYSYNLYGTRLIYLSSLIRVLHQELLMLLSPHCIDQFEASFHIAINAR